MILLLETATPVCSAVICHEGKVLAERYADDPAAHSTQLPGFIRDMLPQVGLEAVCVSSGPGSYTGLRIGVSTAKGLCYALDIPLLSVPTLQSMAAQYYMEHPDYQGLVCPMIDARRMECYAAIYNRQLEALKPTAADIIEEGIYDSYLNENEVVFIGNGAEKTRPILSLHPHARWAEFTLSARGMMQLAEAKLAAGQHEDTAYFEPYYLKDFVAKKPVVKGLRPC